mmetsp:Transcript_101683/g.180266  ORF Transcript_101683/g.180266 Transcript_101683/m.180266 type:complete len:256 (-) Transcript_101683:74-841(-)
MGAEISSGELPEATAKDLIRRYADILRVGQIWVNHERVQWETGCGSDDQLRGFCRGVFGVLQRQAEAQGTEPDPQVLYGVAYWFCKSVSINYAFVDLLKCLNRKFGGPCSIDSGEAGPRPSVDYSVLLRSNRFNPDEYDAGCTLHVSVDWKNKDNIIVHDPASGTSQAKGTLFRMETEFPMPPRRGFAPTYTVYMDTNRSFFETFTARLWDSFVCKQARCKGVDAPDENTTVETFLLEPQRPLLEEVDDAGCAQQ